METLNANLVILVDMERGIRLGAIVDSSLFGSFDMEDGTRPC